MFSTEPAAAVAEFYVCGCYVCEESDVIDDESDVCVDLLLFLSVCLCTCPWACVDEHRDCGKMSSNRAGTGTVSEINPRWLSNANTVIVPSPSMSEWCNNENGICEADVAFNYDNKCNFCAHVIHARAIREPHLEKILFLLLLILLFILLYINMCMTAFKDDLRVNYGRTSCKQSWCDFANK